MPELGKTFLGLGLFLVVLGGAMLLASRFGLPIGGLPGDLIYFPLATSILLSLLFTLILWLLRSFRR